MFNDVQKYGEIKQILVALHFWHDAPTSTSRNNLREVNRGWKTRKDNLHVKT